MLEKKNMTINPNWKMPLYMIGPALGLAVYGTILYSNLMGQLKESAPSPKSRHGLTTLAMPIRISSGQGCQASKLVIEHC